MSEQKDHSGKDIEMGQVVWDLDSKMGEPNKEPKSLAFDYKENFEGSEGEVTIEKTACTGPSESLEESAAELAASQVTARMNNMLRRIMYAGGPDEPSLITYEVYLDGEKTKIPIHKECLVVGYQINWNGITCVVRYAIVDVIEKEGYHINDTKFYLERC